MRIKIKIRERILYNMNNLYTLVGKTFTWSGRYYIIEDVQTHGMDLYIGGKVLADNTFWSMSATRFIDFVKNGEYTIIN